LPDTVVWLELDPAEAERRRDARAKDRIESRGLDYLTRVHDGYQRMAEAGELVRIDGRRPVDEIESAIWASLEPLCAPRGR
jgi:thymidylate kinase